MGRGSSLILPAAEAAAWVHSVELPTIPLPLCCEFFFNLSLLRLQALFFVVFTPFLDHLPECPGYSGSTSPQTSVFSNLILNLRIRLEFKKFP